MPSFEPILNSNRRAGESPLSYVCGNLFGCPALSGFASGDLNDDVRNLGGRVPVAGKVPIVHVFFVRCWLKVIGIDAGGIVAFGTVSTARMHEVFAPGYLALVVVLPRPSMGITVAVLFGLELSVAFPLAASPNPAAIRFPDLREEAFSIIPNDPCGFEGAGTPPPLVVHGAQATGIGWSIAIIDRALAHVESLHAAPSDLVP